MVPLKVKNVMGIMQLKLMVFSAIFQFIILFFKYYLIVFSLTLITLIFKYFSPSFVPPPPPLSLSLTLFLIARCNCRSKLRHFDTFNMAATFTYKRFISCILKIYFISTFLQVDRRYHLMIVKANLPDQINGYII